MIGVQGGAEGGSARRAGSGGSAGSMVVSPAWEALSQDDVNGVIMIIGGVDVGKSTLACYLHEKLSASGRPALLDGDPGQTSHGPPATMALTSAPGDPQGGLTGRFLRRVFIGSTSPRGHMLTALVGASRLVQAAQAEGFGPVIYDTSGLIDPTVGGLALKTAKFDLLQPQVVIAIQRQNELQPLLIPLERSGRTRLIVLEPAPEARRRPNTARQHHRVSQFREHFQHAQTLTFDWTKVAIFPYPRFSLQRLVGLEDPQGFLLALGIVTAIDRLKRSVEILTPLADEAQVNAIRLGNILLNPGTFQHESTDL